MRPRRRTTVVSVLACAALLVVSGVCLMLGILRLEALDRTDATVPIDARSHALRLPPHTQRGVYVTAGAPTPTCTAQDPTTGRAVALRTVRDRFGERVRRSRPEGDDTGRYRFDTGSGRVELTCSDRGHVSATVVAVGPAQSLGIVLRSFGFLWLVAAVTSLAGLAWLVVLIIRLTVRGPSLPAPAPTGRGPASPAG